MNLKKNLTPVIKCPICNEKKFINLGSVDGIHPDLLKLCDLIECKNCKHWFTSKMPKKVFGENLYKTDSEYVFNKEHRLIQKKKDSKKKKINLDSLNIDNWVFKFMKNSKKGNYLEIGTGNGSLLKTFRRHGWHCEGLELQKSFKIKGVFDDIKMISKRNKNVLIFHDILEHVTDPVSLVKQFSKQQKPGDKLFLAYPNSSSFKARILKTGWPMVAPSAHLNFFSISSTKILLEKCGYYPLVIKETSFVILRKLLRSIVRLPITIILDLLNFKIVGAFKRIPEILINILDLIKGDQMNVVGIKK